MVLLLADPADVNGSANRLLLLVAIAMVVLALYLLPTVTGAIRQVGNLRSVVMVNLFLGWTIIGWVVALKMALKLGEQNPIVWRTRSAQTTGSGKPDP